MSPRNNPMRTVGNAVQLIEELAAAGPLSPATAAERIGVPRSSVYRLIDALCATGLVEPLGDGTFRLSSYWLTLSDAARESMIEWDDVGVHLQELVDRTHQTVYLSIHTDKTVTCIEWRRGRGVEVLALRPGRSLPLYAGASGRMLLAVDMDVEAYLSGAPFAPLTPATIVAADALRADIETTRRQGFVHSRQDVTLGIDALGVAIGRQDGSIAGTISLGGLSDAFVGRVDDFVSAMTAAATQLARSPQRHLPAADGRWGV